MPLKPSLIRAFVGLAILAVALPALADTCADDYYAALTRIRETRGPALGSIVRGIRSGEPGMPGSWIFSAKLFPDPKKKPPQPKPERVCVEHAEADGRGRCVRYETRTPPAPPPVTIDTRPTTEEQQAIRFLDEFVRARGAPAEYGANGRFVLVLMRIVAELQSYIGQPANAALCNGVPEMLDFFAGETDAIRKRIDEVAGLVGKARGFADKRTTAAMSLAPTPAPAPAGNIATIAALAELVAGAERAQAVKSKTPPVAALAAARDVVVGQPAAPDQSPNLRPAVLLALRMIEVRTYVDLLDARQKQVDAAVLGIMRDIREAHRKACTCGS